MDNEPSPSPPSLVDVVCFFICDALEYAGIFDDEPNGHSGWCSSTE
jgi:hypothetical protein